ncbi:uncharacterized protein LOC119743423 isoform X1 [Patiria miniata]|uniref:Death domain-containing protein n=1 Tax=Patiria miniata TaxID=46514 RepID=A0A914BJX4_PATMI|nr:uncharacterized protein LOC119743423 isoform X1 [Patiria miniata]XP_038075747.1 uncharacterized protein LOC119743423 isoform X1 [Patiria miniata]XP_038075748.1 uncharacterized protein LOC119743423 isoform X1 [Patiria miniata]XP_038075749.1 uncharacterized protein LOC119743423 isoform X1 [Patiria miniata]XP_038075750.1 uncharacterized protein LOC119743423 isoform X1 [Patiria miniata]XP_038075751.1 uncharacterized protein LOC119743423 isoform X1 [Patiria miniata]
MAWHFHSSCHGSNISVRSTALTVIRNPDTYDNGITFSDTQIQAGTVVSLFFKKSTNRWAGMPRIGFTNQNPAQVDTQSLPSIYTKEVSYQSHTWAMSLEKGSENIFVDYTFDEIGLVTVRQLGWPEKLQDTRGAVNFKRPVWATVDLSGCYTCVMKNEPSAYMPLEIVEQGVNAQHLYIEALSMGSRSVYHTRLVLIGQGREEKTCLMKTLTNDRYNTLESCGGGIDNSLTVKIDGTKSWHDFREAIEQGQAGTRLHAGVGDSVDDVFLNIWHFAGQDLHGPTNQVLFTHRAVYLMVFNLGCDLHKPAVIESVAPDGRKVVEHHELTNWECMDMWMQTMYMYVNTGKQSLVATERTSPAIIIVGTHRDSLGKDTEEKVKAQFANIREALQDAPYKQHVISQDFAVENSLEDYSQAEILALKTLIAEVSCSEYYMGEEIPLKWLQFEEARLRSSPIMSVAMVRQTIEKSIGNMADAEAMLMLKYYHDIGEIICFDGQKDSPLSQDPSEAFLADRRWLIKVFQKFATIHEAKDQSPSLMSSLERLNKEGILEDPLINHLLGDVLSEIQERPIDSTLDTKQALLGSMHKLDLLCERLDQNAGGGEWMETNAQVTTRRTYYVPSLLGKYSITKRHPLSPESSYIFYIHFVHIVPDSLFNQLVVRALGWSQAQDGTEQLPRIAHRYACFPADGDHEVEMEMSPLKQAYIRVCISKHSVIYTSTQGPSKSRRLQCKPSPIIVCKVRDFLCVTLKSIKSMWAKGLKFHLCVSCPCDPEGALHFLLLDECLEKERVCCHEQPGVRIDTSGIKQMFVESGPSSLRKLDPYVMSEKHLLAIAAELGPEWERLAVSLGFTQSNLYRFKQDNSVTDNAIFSMLVAWSKREGGDIERKLQVLSEAIDECGRRDVVEKMLHIYM